MRNAIRTMQRHDADLIKEAMYREWKARREEFARLQAHGYVSVMADEQPDVIRVRIDQEYFTDKRDVFPTTRLMARLQLAVAAGQTDRNAPSYPARPNPVWRNEPLYDFKTGGDYLYVDKSPVTATVKRKMKGLRP